MDIEEGMLRKIGVSVAVVGVFVALVLVIGFTFGTGGSLSGIGGLALVGAIVLFIVLMAAVGFVLAD